MATVVVRLDTLGLDDALKNLGQKEVRARVRALNRTIATAQTEARRAIAEDTGLPQRVIAQSLSVERAVFGRPTATLQATGRRIPLYDFTRQRKLRGRPTGKGAVPGAFIARMASGHVGIFKRVGKSRSRKGLPPHAPGLPITELFGPSLPFVFTNEKIMGALLAHAKENLAKNYRHEVQFLERAHAS
jgi:minor tail protein Z (GPZ)